MVERVTRGGLVLVLAGLCASCGETFRGFGDASILIASGESGQPDPDPALEGTLEVDVQVYFRDTSNFWIELTNGPRTVSVPLADGAMEEVMDRRLGVGFYPEIRIVFSTIEAEITGGLMIGGEPFVGTIRVPTSPEITVERPLDLFVDDREPLAVVIELSAAEWLPTASEDTHEVTPEAFVSGVRLRPGT